MDLTTVDLILIAAAGRGELVCDTRNPYGYRWDDRPVDYDCFSRVFDLATDGLLTDPGITDDADAEYDGQRLTVTDAGWKVLR